MYLAYFVSFMTIGAVWIEHSALVDALDHIDGVFMRLNPVLLLFCAFLPFPTRMMSEWAGVLDAQRIAVVFYGFVLQAMVLMLIVLGRYGDRCCAVRTGWIRLTGITNVTRGTDH